MTLTREDHTLDLLADVAGSFATPDPARVRAWRDAGGAVDREMWQRIADNGWFSIMVPSERDGAGPGIDAACVVARRLGYACFPEPFAAGGVLTPLVLAECDDDGPLTAAVAGDLLIGVGWQNEVVAEDTPDGPSLTGT